MWAAGVLMAIDYYDERAAEFFQDTARVDMTALHERFSRYLPPRSRILDAGCGSGRDALAFTRAGFSVIAFDG
jgi:2-polyprenyl-3-methyl-5-hydroxy-6-metoxy-1,4-benzoquinol methylase